MIPAANVAAAGEERERRRGHDADQVDVDAHARRPGRDRRHEHVARAAGVLADDERAARPDELVGRRPAEGVGEGRLEVDVGDAADPVGAEEAGHRQGACRSTGTATAAAAMAGAIGDGHRRPSAGSAAIERDAGRQGRS